MSTTPAPTPTSEFFTVTVMWIAGDYSGIFTQCQGDAQAFAMLMRRCDRVKRVVLRRHQFKIEGENLEKVF